MSSVSLLINEVCAESLSSPRLTLDKECFSECPIKCTQQSADHSAKSQIQVVKPRWEWHKEAKQQQRDDKMCGWNHDINQHVSLTIQSSEELICSTAKSSGGGAINYALECAAVAFALSASIIALM